MKKSTGSMYSVLKTFRFRYVLGMIGIIVTALGCSNYSFHNGTNSIAPRYLESPVGGGNPFLVFDHSSNSQSTAVTNSESILRWDWPIAQTQTGYVTYSETMDYEEQTYSDQFISSDNVPRQNYHRRVYGQRTGRLYR